MLTSVHRFAALFAFGLIATFMAATLMAEGFLSYAAIADVKQAIVYALFVLVPLLAMTGGSGFALSRRSEHPLVAAKRRRMPVIALNGILVLMPLALFLNLKAGQGAFDLSFYGAQALELVAGGVNLWLIGLNIRDGMRLRGRTSTALQAPV